MAVPFLGYRHEPFVKRPFKLAEAAGDDEVMGAFLVALDRTVRGQPEADAGESGRSRGRR